jgi:prepilin-type N-terminal cleavage/methylation domain-containing protein
MKRKSFNLQKAFTLIELLIVIAIIAIVATLSVLALNSARVKARDAKRVADIKQIRSALELYNSDHDAYPPTANFIIGQALTGVDSKTGEVKTYINSIPSSPKPADGDCDNQNNDYSYVLSSANSYVLNYCLGGKAGEIQEGLNTASQAGMYIASSSGSGSGDNSCVSNCASSSLACGATDNCGDICQSGSCVNPQDVCVNGACQCQPECANKTCGANDGCGGTCQSGSCPNSGDVCQSGVCVAPTSCNLNSECTVIDPNLICFDNTCQSPMSCTTTSFCHNNLSTDYQCVNGGCRFSYCTSHSQCAAIDPNLVCAGNIDSDGMFCISKEICDISQGLLCSLPDLVCINNICEPGTSCSNSSQCFASLGSNSL